MFEVGQKVKINRRFMCYATPPVIPHLDEQNPGDICTIYRDEGFGCFILKSRRGNLFAATRGEFEPLEEVGE